MNLNTIDDAQILIAEMQSEIVQSSITHPPESLRRAAAALKRIAGAFAIPITASAVSLSEEPPRLIDELGPIRIFVRNTISMLGDEKCRAQVASNRRGLLAIAGISSEIAILHTALDARRAGYDVSILVDCCGGLSDRTEATAFEQMRAAGVTVTNISSFFTAFLNDMGSREGEAVMAMLGELWSWHPGSNETDRA